MTYFLCHIVWNPSPVFNVLGIDISWYGLLFALGFFIAYTVLYVVFKYEKIPLRKLDWLTLSFFLATLIGARLGHVFFYEWAYYKQNLSEIIMLQKGGLASHGAAIAIVIMLVVFARINRMKTLWLFDRVAIVIPMVGAFVRLGNLMNSEIYGHVTTQTWGFVFMATDKAGNLPRHPTQLYEALVYILITGLLIWLYKRNKGNIGSGLFAGIFLVMMFTSRFIIEFFKEVQVDFEKNWSLDLGQWLSIPFMVMGIFFIVYAVRKKKVKTQYYT